MARPEHTLWQDCNGAEALRPISGRFERLVESQEQVATSQLVDDLDEQALLEQLLEGSKPRLPASCHGLHYLLATPFRYPPLRHGTRFGGRHEPSLLYASLEASTAMAETAYYRLLFLSGMTEPPPTQRLVSQHTLFTARYSTRHGVRLQAPPFADCRETLTDPADYRATQALGKAMREAGVEAFEYVSARTPNERINVALFQPSALATKTPEGQQNWLCETRAEGVRFYSGEATEVFRFPLEGFLVDGRLPAPSVS